MDIRETSNREARCFQKLIRLREIYILGKGDQAERQQLVTDLRVFGKGDDELALRVRVNLAHLEHFIGNEAEARELLKQVLMEVAPSQVRYAANMMYGTSLIGEKPDVAMTYYRSAALCADGQTDFINAFHGMSAAFGPMFARKGNELSPPIRELDPSLGWIPAIVVPDLNGSRSFWEKQLGLRVMHLPDTSVDVLMPEFDAPHEREADVIMAIIGDHALDEKRKHLWGESLFEIDVNLRHPLHVWKVKKVAPIRDDFGNAVTFVGTDALKGVKA
jgi:plasmid stability protein/catechol 2,3-dioxygenase-like lactoylglutathione lyase family enzyme